MKKLLVKDWMTEGVITVETGTVLLDAAALMREKDIRRLPVLENGILVGIISQRDILAAQPSDATSLDIWEVNYLLSRLRIERVMTRNPYTVQPDSTVREAARLMYEHRVGGIPVVDADGHLVGIITESDIYRLVIAWVDEEMSSAAPKTAD